MRMEPFRGGRLEELSEHGTAWNSCLEQCFILETASSTKGRGRGPPDHEGLTHEGEQRPAPLCLWDGHVIMVAESQGVCLKEFPSDSSVAR